MPLMVHIGGQNEQKWLAVFLGNYVKALEVHAKIKESHLSPE